MRVLIVCDFGHSTEDVLRPACTLSCLSFSLYSIDYVLNVNLPHTSECFRFTSDLVLPIAASKEGIGSLGDSRPVPRSIRKLMSSRE
jgi:hypothetical protein